MTLRSELVKLAHARPELRAHLLPLIRTKRVAGADTFITEADFKKGCQNVARKFGLVVDFNKDWVNLEALFHRKDDWDYQFDYYIDVTYNGVDDPSTGSLSISKGLVTSSDRSQSWGSWDVPRDQRALEKILLKEVGSKAKRLGSVRAKQGRTLSRSVQLKPFKGSTGVGVEASFRLELVLQDNYVPRALAEISSKSDEMRDNLRLSDWSHDLGSSGASASGPMLDCMDGIITLRLDGRIHAKDGMKDKEMLAIVKKRALKEGWRPTR